MELADRMTERLATSPSVDGARVAEWRLALSERRSVGVGMKHNRIGGPYDAPGASIGTSGGLYLVWDDGRISYGDLDSRSFEELDQRLTEWRAAAYDDEWRPEVLGSQPMPSVEVYDPAVAAQVGGDPSPMFAMLERARRECGAAGCELVDGGAGASVGEAVLRSSHGLDVTYEETSCSVWVSADEVYSRSWSKRRLIAVDELDEVIGSVARTVPRLAHQDTLAGGPLTVLMPTATASSFIGKFVMANLAGAGVVNGQSAYTLHDFHTHRQVAGPDVDFVLDTTLPFESGTSPCSGEGVPGGRTPLVEHGSLVSPMLDLKYARRAGMPPSPLPRQGSALQIVAALEPSWEAALASIERGLLVFELLGMHTQDSAKGDYSVVASQALAIRDGVLGGRVKATLVGNFFSNLLDPTTRFVPYSIERNPGMFMRCDALTE
ncbi:MAG: PmbA protein [Chloroflexota bacterium]|jgi:PmbA protein|nr:PmbA protein [Chloroflexota bacterium]